MSPGPLLPVQKRGFLSPGTNTNSIRVSNECDVRTKPGVVMPRQDFEDAARLDLWGDPLHDGAEYCFYDPQGELICKADLYGMGDVRFSQYAADLQRSLFLCNSIQQDNSIRVVDINGNVLIVKQFDWMADNYGWYITDAFCGMMLADDWFESRMSEQLLMVWQSLGQFR